MTLLVKVELRYSTIQPSWSCWCKRSIGSRLVPSFSHYSNHMLVSTYILHIGKRRKENLTKVQIWQSNLDCSNSNLLSWEVKIIMPKLENQLSWYVFFKSLNSVQTWIAWINMRASSECKLCIFNSEFKWHFYYNNQLINSKLHGGI